MNPKRGLWALLALLWLSTPLPGQLMHGYLGVPNEAPGQEFGGGFSMYVAAWPLLEEWPGSQFQTGLFGTWMFAQKREPKPEGQVYSDIEGGLGWWRDTRFATATPKFIMGGVTLNFASWANGPGAGKGRDWNKPLGKYGVAQLSPHLLWPPDGLNLAQGTCGELFGYGYLPLPLTDAKTETAGHPVKTGDQSWTLFLNTANFKGPVAFFTPFFFAEATIERPDLAERFLDAQPADPNRAVQMETQYIPAMIVRDAEGVAYARTAKTRFPKNAENESVLVHHLRSYRHAALFEAVKSWFAGGEIATGLIDAKESFVHPMKGKGWSTWKMGEPGLSREDERRLDWASFAESAIEDRDSFAYRFSEDLVTRSEEKGQKLFTLPDTFVLSKQSGQAKPQWKPIDASKLPDGVKAELDRARFVPAKKRAPEAYTTPEDGVWATPGPVAGPFEARLGDGSVLTYSWYRFADQPALWHADLNAKAREELQRRVELLHRHWTKDRAYLPPPTRGTLASLDAGLFVKPPTGFEIGYVPIVTRQGLPETKAPK